MVKEDVIDKGFDLIIDKYREFVEFIEFIKFSS